MSKKDAPEILTSKQVVEKIKKVSTDNYKQIMSGESPTLTMPIRSLSNVKFTPEVGYFELVGQESLGLGEIYTAVPL